MRTDSPRWRSRKATGNRRRYASTSISPATPLAAAGLASAAILRLAVAAGCQACGRVRSTRYALHAAPPRSRDEAGAGYKIRSMFWRPN